MKKATCEVFDLSIARQNANYIIYYAVIFSSLHGKNVVKSHTNAQQVNLSTLLQLFTRRIVRCYLSDEKQIQLA